MSECAGPFVGNGCHGFTAADMAFALAWELFAPGLCGWTVRRESEDGSDDLILVDPPLVYGDGFTIRADHHGVVIAWEGGRRQARTLRDALLLICPLAPDALARADDLAGQPDPL